MKGAGYVLAGFVVAAVGLGAIGILAAGEGVGSNPALQGFRAAIQVLAGGLVSVVSHYLGRRHDREGLPCPVCSGEFRTEEAFLAHPCAVRAVAAGQTP